MLHSSKKINKKCPYFCHVPKTLQESKIKQRKFQSSSVFRLWLVAYCLLFLVRFTVKMENKSEKFGKFCSEETMCKVEASRDLLAEEINLIKRYQLLCTGTRRKMP